MASDPRPALSALRRRLVTLWNEGGSILHWFVLIIVVFLLAGVWQIAAKGYDWLMVDRPVHYKELAKPWQEIHRKGLYLAAEITEV